MFEFLCIIGVRNAGRSRSIDQEAALANGTGSCGADKYDLHVNSVGVEDWTNGYIT